MLMRATVPLDQPRAIGEAILDVKAHAGRSRIKRLRQSGALKMVFPRDAEDVQAVIVNTAGGITGGDRFRLAACAGVGATLRLTTQAAERAYRAQPDQTGTSETILEVQTDARLEWLPQETILYDGASFARRLTVMLAAGARFLMVEPLLFGRLAMGEEVRQLRFDDRIEINRQGNPLVRDGMRWRDNAAAQLDRPAIGGGARALATIFYVAPDAEVHLDPVRHALGATGGASLIAPDVLSARVLAADAFDLRRGLLPVLDRLTNNKLPASWRL